MADTSRDSATVTVKMHDGLWRNWLIVLLFGFLIATGRCTEPLLGVQPSMRVAKDVVLPLGEAGGRTILKFRAGRAYMDRKVVGFLKFGLLPQLVLEDVEVTILNSLAPATWGRELNSFLTSNPTLSLAILKGFKILAPSRAGSVSAAKARFDNKKQALILEHVEVQCTTLESFHGGKATLHLQGSNVGRLSLAGTDDRIIEISSEGFLLQN
jgi:hypothetical protein